MRAPGKADLVHLDAVVVLLSTKKPPLLTVTVGSTLGKSRSSCYRDAMGLMAALLVSCGRESSRNEANPTLSPHDSILLAVFFSC